MGTGRAGKQDRQEEHGAMSGVDLAHVPQLISAREPCVAQDGGVVSCTSTSNFR
jgi:hypothetical protein